MCNVDWFLFLSWSGKPWTSLSFDFKAPAFKHGVVYGMNRAEQKKTASEEAGVGLRMTECNGDYQGRSSGNCSYDYWAALKSKER